MKAELQKQIIPILLILCGTFICYQARLGWEAFIIAGCIVGTGNKS